jgi:hypothetical protein
MPQVVFRLYLHAPFEPGELLQVTKPKEEMNLESYFLQDSTP